MSPDVQQATDVSPARFDIKSSEMTTARNCLIGIIVIISIGLGYVQDRGFNSKLGVLKQ